MDVTFSNVLEGARQYFQGLPAATGSTASPIYTQDSTSTTHHRNDSESNEMPPSSSSTSSVYWPPPHQQQDPNRPPTREQQRPPSHHSDTTSRPPSHSQYIEPGRQQNVVVSQYQQNQYQESQNQSYQFSRPQSRDQPSNYNTQQQQQQQYHVPTSTPYPRHDLVPPQTSHAYHNYQQSRPYYPTSQPQTKSVPNSYKPPNQVSYPSSSHSQHQNSYYKHVYTTSAQPQQVHQYQYTTNQRPNPQPQETQNQHTQNHYASMSNEEQAFRATHNLPPIASLSSVNYHSNRLLREPTRPVTNNRPPPRVVPSSANSIQSPSGSSIIQANPARVPPYSSDNYNYRNTSSYTSQPSRNQSYQYSTSTTQSYNSVIMTTSSTSSSYTAPLQSQQSSNSAYYQTNKTNVVRSQPVVQPPPPQPLHPQPPPNMNGRMAPQVVKQKRESPLDLSVKTVRTPADSTALDDADHESRNKYYQNQRTPSISTHNYPTYDVHSFQRNLTQRSSQQLIQTGAPKIEFHPNFNVPSLNHQPRSTAVESHRLYQPPIPEKAYKPNPYISSGSKQYPTVSIPSAAHVNSYIQSQQPPPGKKQASPRSNYPPTPTNAAHKSSIMYPQVPERKRPLDMPTTVPNKVPKVDSWRQTIDEQIEQRFSSYKQQQQQQKSMPNVKPTLPNGNYAQMNHDKLKSMYSNYPKQSYESQHPTYSSASPYNSQTSHTQTYVPSPGNQQYPPGYTNYPPNDYIHHSARNITNSTSQMINNNKKNNVGAAADKRTVLSLLRTSLEEKAGQKKLEQLKSNDHVVHQHPRTDIQHPSTDVTAPIQPKPVFIGRNNVSPFTPTNFPESNTNLMYKFHIPRAIDSVNYETDGKSIVDKHLDNNHTVIPNHANPNNDYDGLAAFLAAARIRTKGELKQVSSAQQQQQANNNINNSQLHGIIENQLKSPIKQEVIPQQASKNSNPPKLLKERASIFPPRRRLFSRNEEETGNHAPPRDKSGMRSSSETSVFDFPDSDSENEMPVLERQSLEEMRRDRKSSIHKSISTEKLCSSRPPSPEDDKFAEMCDTFMEQLKNNAGNISSGSSGKKRPLRKKKIVEPEVLAKLETVITKENPTAKVKIEVEQVENKNKIENTPLKEPENNLMTPSTDNKDDDDDDDEIIKVERRDKARRRILSSSDSDSEIDIKANKVQQIKSINDTVSKIAEVKSSTPLVARPAKKPSFGDGSDFYPGWEEGVYKYKKSLRMPPSLIQVTRPPQFHRLSTSLPDLDPCPHSPTPSSVADNTEFPKTKYKKIKSEPIDSDTESNCSFNLFSKNNSYDSEGSASIKSLPSTTKGGKSILDTLLEKCGGKKRRKYKKKDEGNPKIIPKAENPIELLPTPSLAVAKKETDKKLATPIIKTESPLLEFRKKTVDNFKDAFLKSNHLNDQFATVVLKSRTRKETRVLKQRATIKEVFGEDRPASAPPVTCVNEMKEETNVTEYLRTEIKKEKEDAEEKAQENDQNETPNTKQMLKNKLLNKGRKKTDLLKTLVDKKIKQEIQVDLEDLDNSLDDIIKRDPDTKSETQSVDGDEDGLNKKKNKLRNCRRKFSSGFDYIRKKKKVKKECENEKVKKRIGLAKTTPESVQDVQKEIKTWVLNKGIGETHLHRAARLGYTDITAYCLEKMECLPSPKDNAGYTPLHEACSRGHLEIAKLLLLFGANVSESAQGGIRPLHEAVENGFVEIVRLLLSYGADPNLATYSGLTPLSLANDDATADLLKNHISDVEGVPGPPWQFPGPASCFEEALELGYDILSDIPDADPESEDDDIEFEISDSLLPNLYSLRGESSSDRWILLQDLSNMLKIKSRDALLRQICPTASSSSSSSAPVNYKTILRELKMSDFLEQAHCCQFLNSGEKINTRASKIALIKYTDKVKELLNVESIVISAS